jgi:hydroxyacylglutathione hydrolase
LYLDIFVIEICISIGNLEEMEIKQFKEKNSGHYSYAVISNGEVALIDPSGDTALFYDFAKNNQAAITAIIQTCSCKSDIINSCREIQQKTGATIYVSKFSEVTYTHQPFDEGDAIVLGHISLKALNTPGFSSDSICVVVLNEIGFAKAVFTGNTLFEGDCGKPEEKGNTSIARKSLAIQMYLSLRNKLMTLPDKTVVYPGYDSIDLCSDEKRSSTIGIEKMNNWSLQEMEEDEFVNKLLGNQPHLKRNN